MGALPNAEKQMLEEFLLKENQIAALNNKIYDLMWPISKDGILRWPVMLHLLLHSIGSDKVISSRDFYTDEGGHMMSAEIQVHGQGVALYLNLKKGPYDASIKWPFPFPSVSFQMRRHDGGEPWESLYEVDPIDEKFSRPVGDSNEKFGFFNFISWNYLLCPENKLIENGTISVMIAVNR